MKLSIELINCCVVLIAAWLGWPGVILVWILHLIVSFSCLAAIVITMLCSAVPPMLLGLISKKSAKKLTLAISTSTPIL